MTERKRFRDAGRAAAESRTNDAAAHELLEDTRDMIRASVGEDPPESVVMSASVMALMSAMADIDVLAATPGVARALASFAVAEGLNEEQLIITLRTLWAPTFVVGKEQEQ